MSTNKTISYLVLFLIALSAWFRIATYGDFRLSIGNADTNSYIKHE